MTTTETRPREDWDGTPIPVERWGKDHWSTLAYVETRIVGYLATSIGVPRCVEVWPRRWRGSTSPSWSTRLRDALLYGHTDYDCLADMVTAGFLTPPVRAHYGTGETRIVLTHRYEFTPLGLDVAQALRRHKASGGNFAQFTWEADA